MAHRPIGSTQTDRIRLPYTAPEASRRAFFVKELYRGTAWKGGHAAPDPGSVQVKIQDGNNQLCFQPTAQIFVHLGTGIIESLQSTMMLRRAWITTISGTAILSFRTMLLLMFDMKPSENILDI